MELLNPELNVCRHCAHAWRTQIQNHPFRKTTPSETPRKCPRCSSTTWNLEKFTSGTKAGCTICKIPELAQAIADDLVGCLPLISIKRRRGVPLLALRKHWRLCLRGTEIEKRIHAAEIAREQERDRAAEAESANLHAKHEAKLFFALVGCEGQSVEALRAEIPINEVGAQCLETLFGEKFAREFVRDRLEILREFDRLVAQNDQSLRKEIERRRAAVVQYYEKHTPTLSCGARGAYEHSRVAAEGGDEWDI